LDKPDSYLETSATAMFVYAVARAVNQGWIPPVYFTIAEKGWEGLVSKITPDGKEEDVCIGTGILDELLKLRTQLGGYLMRTGDPRVTGAGDVFESYPRLRGDIRKFPEPERRVVQ
jgi:rhamnogalacturonyl hydrolase YesR